MLDTKRHDALFDKRAFDEDVHVIGTGGVGSAVARQLAKLGIGCARAFHLWDGDTVAPHNLANQAYAPAHIGKSKTDALAEQIRTWSDGTEAISHPSFVTGSVPLSGIVFLCLDSMHARKDICEQSLFRNPAVPLTIETRMDASSVIIHAFDPRSETHIEYWNMYWYPDAEMENEAGCNGPISVISTVEMTASMAVAQLIAYSKARDAGMLYNQVQLSLRTWEIKKAMWQ